MRIASPDRRPTNARSTRSRSWGSSISSPGFAAASVSA
ncbi:Uncharacterised protein [Mycobacteroides abscessus]|nr:Uncharacterised protein [Mycobacteroides abscessus]